MDKLVEPYIKSYPDFPQKGIMFRDIHPLMADPKGRKLVIDHLVERYKDKQIDAIIGLESRGYYFGIPLACELNVPFVPLRKAGKLPGEVVAEEYQLEYKANERMEAQKGSIKEGSTVVIVDDLLATGGTAACGCNLVQKLGGKIEEFVAIIELSDLKGRDKAPEGVKYHTLISY